MTLAACLDVLYVEDLNLFKRVLRQIYPRLRSECKVIMFEQRLQVFRIVPRNRVDWMPKNWHVFDLKFIYSKSTKYKGEK